MSSCPVFISCNLPGLLAGAFRIQYVGKGIGIVYFAAPVDDIVSPTFEGGTETLSAYENWVGRPPSTVAPVCVVNSLSSLLSLYCICGVDVFTLCLCRRL